MSACCFRCSSAAAPDSAGLGGPWREERLRRSVDTKTSTSIIATATTQTGPHRVLSVTERLHNVPPPPYLLRALAATFVSTGAIAVGAV